MALINDINTIVNGIAKFPSISVVNGHRDLEGTFLDVESGTHQCFRFCISFKAKCGQNKETVQEHEAMSVHS